MSEHIRGYKGHRSLGLQMRFTMVAYRELQKFGGRLSTRLFPDSFLESTLWMKHARLRSEWTNSSFIFSVSDLWMSVLTSTARFVSSHDLPKRRWITNISPLVQQDLCLKTSLNRSCFIWNDTGVLWFTAESLLCLLSPRHASMAAVRARGWSGGVWMRGGRCPVMMVEGTDAPLRNISTGNRDSEHLSFPWGVTLLSSVLITTIIVDVLGNLLVIVSVFRNRKLRKAGNVFISLTHHADSHLFIFY